LGIIVFYNLVFSRLLTYFDHRFLDNQITELEDNATYYQDEIHKDEKQIKQLKNPEQIEKYARKILYEKDSEDIYIIEFEGDSITTNLELFKINTNDY
jgi:cell division protein FtsB